MAGFTVPLGMAGAGSGVSAGLTRGRAGVVAAGWADGLGGG